MQIEDTLVPAPLWEMHDPGPGFDADLSGDALRLARALTADGACGMLPPVLEPGPDGMLIFARQLHGPRHARMLAHALTSARFAPLLDLVTRLDELSAAAASRYASVVAPGVLTAANAGLLGPARPAMATCSKCSSR